MQTIELSRYINKPVDELYELVADMESYPTYMENIISVRVLAHNSGKTVTAWIAEIDGIRLAWQEEDAFFPEELVIRFRQLEGDMSHYEGEWSLQPAPDGSILNLKVTFDLGIPMISGLIEYLLSKKVENSCREMLSRIQEVAEKDNIPNLKTKT